VLTRERPIIGLGGPRQRRGAAHASPPSLHSEVLRLQRTAGNRAVLQILRQPATSGGTAAPTTAQTPAPPAQAKPPTVGPGRDENELIITRADGTRFHVRRRVRAQQVTNPGRTRAGFCHDDDRVWLRITWCEGTQGTIDVGANPQGAIRDVVNTALGQINRGANVDQIKQTLENASIRPFAEAEIAQVGNWKITGDFSVDVSKAGGLGRRSGQIKGDVGWAQVGVEYSDTGTPTDGSQRDRRVDVNVTIPLSKRKVQGKKCPLQELAVWWEYDCLREQKTKELIPVKGGITYHDKLFLYFDYAKDNLRSNGKSGTARLNRINLDRLDSLVSRGYWPTSINGYTSPEGRRGGPGAKDRGKAREWEGNDALSQKRAAKVQQLIKQRYLGKEARTLHTRTPPPIGKTEFPLLETVTLGKDGPVARPWERLQIKEVEGDALDSAVVGKFRKEHPEENTRMTDEDRAFIENPGHSTRARAERMFENLRRVEINLSHFEKFKDVPHEGVELVRDDDECPTDIAEAAEERWGSRIPFVKADPPLCN